MTRTDKPGKCVVDLSYFGDVGLILCRPSGVLYTNQVAGYACLHPQIEGVFLPLPVNPGRAELWALQRHFRGVWAPLNEELANVVDNIFARNGHPYLTVNRAKLSESYEAWIHMLVDGTAELQGPLPPVFSGFSQCEGVLTWPNSD